MGLGSEFHTFNSTACSWDSKKSGSVKEMLATVKWLEKLKKWASKKEKHEHFPSGCCRALKKITKAKGENRCALWRSGHGRQYLSCVTNSHKLLCFNKSHHWVIFKSKKNKITTSICKWISKLGLCILEWVMWSFWLSKCKFGEFDD